MPDHATDGHTDASQRTPKFQVAARTLLHLGRELITSDEVALNELIKNSFDAGSEVVNVELVCPVPTSLLLESVETVSCHGATLSTTVVQIAHALQDAAAKRFLSEELWAQFQKNLQRLSASKTVEQAKDALEKINYIEVIDTGCGISSKHIASVFLKVGTDFKLDAKMPKPDNVPTYLGNKGIGRLAMMRLGDRASVVTWQQKRGDASVVEFDWRAFDNADMELSDVPVAVSTAPPPHPSDSGTIVRIFALKSDWTKDRVVDPDGLQPFIRRLRNPFSSRGTFRIRLSINGDIPVPFKAMSKDIQAYADQHLTLKFFPDKCKRPQDSIFTATIRMISGDNSEDAQTRTASAVMDMLKVSFVELKAIGPFVLDILRFNRGKLRERTKGDDYHATLAELNVWGGGIAIYRDGFRVGFTGSERDGDWLGLDHKALRGGGYIVNRIQVIGALQITHDGNPGLIDLTNREGLVSTPAAELLKLVLLAFGIGPLRSVVEVQGEKDKRASLENLINDGTSTLNDRLKLAKRDVARLAEAAPKALQTSISSLDKHIHFITTQVSKFESAIEKLGEKREDIIELAGVGNVMHGVMHELTRSTTQTRELMQSLAKGADSQTKDLLEKLEGEIRAINTRLRQLDPLLPGARQSKAEIDVGKLTQTVLSGYKSRFDRHGILPELKFVGGSRELKVKMVPGFLSLALENLISNSVYWIGQRSDKTVDGAIRVEIDAKSKVVTVTDNGPGVAVADRERVFLPGFSLRHRGKGYGLYLAREVAEYHGGKLYLDPDIDANDGNLHTFVLELPR